MMEEKCPYLKVDCIDKKNGICTHEYGTCIIPSINRQDDREFWANALDLVEHGIEP